MFEWVHYQFPPKIHFERDSTHKIGSFAREIGRRIMILTMESELYNPDELSVIKTSLDRNTSGAIIYDDIKNRPTFDELDTAAHFVKQSQSDIILAYGSRETFFAARAIALLSQNDIFAADLFPNNFPPRKAPMPVVAVPAAPSMGEEAIPGVLLYDHETEQVHFGADSRLFPAMIYVDANILSSLSDNELARNATAGLAGAIEAMLSKRANEITNSIALRSLDTTARALPRGGSEVNQSVRNNISMGMTLCGMALSNTLGGTCYSIAVATSLHTGVNFYVCMSILLPHVMEYNLTTSAGKYVQIARALEEDTRDITVIEAAIKAVEGIRKIYIELQVPQRLSDFEIEKSALPDIARIASNFSLMKNTARQLDKNEVETILLAAY